MILGVRGVEALRHVADSLRERTRATAEEISARNLSFYTPWLGFAPVIGNELSNERLLDLPYLRGSVIADEAYLREVARFLARHEDLTVANLIGSKEDWAILQTPACVRPDVVRAIVSASAVTTSASSFFKEIYDVVVEMVIPLASPRARGWSCHYMRGVIFLGLAPNYPTLDLALDLVHELGHQSLALLQSCDPIIASDHFAPVYSQVRRAMRPAIQSLHAAAAIAYMTQFAHDIGQSSYVHPEFDAPMPVVLRHALTSLDLACAFTDVGNAVMEDFHAIADIAERGAD